MSIRPLVAETTSLRRFLAEEVDELRKLAKNRRAASFMVLRNKGKPLPTTNARVWPSGMVASRLLP